MEFLGCGTAILMHASSEVGGLDGEVLFLGDMCLPLGYERSCISIAFSGREKCEVAVVWECVGVGGVRDGT